MLYLDSSVIVKRYVREAGTDRLRARCRQEEFLFTSALSYAEVLAAFSRKFREGALSRAQFDHAASAFLADWLHFQKLELDARTLAAVRSLVERYAIRGADAVHLSAGLWLRDATRLQTGAAFADLEFSVADVSLARIAADIGLSVFNPEQAQP